MSHTVSFPPFSGGVNGKNMGLNSNTSPAWWDPNIGTNQVALVSVYMTTQTNTVHNLDDQPPLPAGSEVYEKRASATQYHPINQKLGENSTYKDPVGFVYPESGYQIVSSNSQSYTNWVNSPPKPWPPLPPSKTNIQDIAIRINGTNAGSINRKVIIDNLSGSSTTNVLLRIKETE